MKGVHFLDPKPNSLSFYFLVNTPPFIKAIQGGPCKLGKNISSEDELTTQQATEE